jgi:protein ImuB
VSFVCLWSPAWPTGSTSIAGLGPALLAHTPRVAETPGLIWADGRGLDQRSLRAALLDLIEENADARDTRIAIASTSIAAEVAATRGASPIASDAPRVVSRTTELHPEQAPAVPSRPIAESPLVVVPPGADREFLAPFSVDVLQPPPDIDRLFEGIGVSSCGQLAALERESIEVRLGPDAVPLWRRARGDDDRRIFTTVARQLPHASMEWVDYGLRDGERMQFIVNALAARVCTTLDERGEGARQVALVVSLANRETRTESVRFGRPTASRKAWMRQLRLVLDRLSLPDAVTGLLLRVDLVAGMHAPQGDLFDRGFASAQATEQALGDIADDQGEVFFSPNSTKHPLLEQRARWTPQDPATLAEPHHAVAPGARTAIAPRLTLQLLPQPRPIAVSTTERRDHEVPVRYREDDHTHELVDVAGPDRISGGQWESMYAREYFRCVRGDGLLVWIFRDAGVASGAWFLHGWWD